MWAFGRTVPNWVTLGGHLLPGAGGMVYSARGFWWVPPIKEPIIPSREGDWGGVFRNHRGRGKGGLIWA